MAAPQSLVLHLAPIDLDAPVKTGTASLRSADVQSDW
jgi:hypothetical protein